MKYIDLGVKEAGELLLGGSKADVVKGGNYIMPTIFDGVSNDMTIAREEIFGPVLSILTFDSIDQAGVVYVNCYDHSNIIVPFGGFKQSGFGWDKSLHALKKYTQLKTSWVNLN